MENNTQNQVSAETADLVRIYTRNARTVAIVGIVLFAGGIIGAKMTAGGAHTAGVLIAIIGFLFTVFGLGNLQHNAKIRSFSALVMRAPENRAAAEGLLSLLEGHQTLRLSRQASTALGNAVAVYRMSADADPEIADKFDEICRNHIKTSIL